MSFLQKNIGIIDTGKFENMYNICYDTIRTQTFRDYYSSHKILYSIDKSKLKKASKYNFKDKNHIFGRGAFCRPKIKDFLNNLNSNTKRKEKDAEFAIISKKVFKDIWIGDLEAILYKKESIGKYSDQKIRARELFKSDLDIIIAEDLLDYILSQNSREFTYDSFTTIFNMLNNENHEIAIASMLNYKYDSYDYLSILTAYANNKIKKSLVNLKALRNFIEFVENDKCTDYIKSHKSLNNNFRSTFGWNSKSLIKKSIRSFKKTTLRSIYKFNSIDSELKYSEDIISILKKSDYRFIKFIIKTYTDRDQGLKEYNKQMQKFKNLKENYEKIFQLTEE